MPRSRRRRGPPAGAPEVLRGAQPVEFVIDLHGMKPEAALQALERHIEVNYAARSPWVHVIHGRGTGKLREDVRAALHRHRLVGRYYYAPYNNGGDGVTIAELQYGQPRRRRNGT